MSLATGDSSTGDRVSSTSKSLWPDDTAREKLLMMKGVMRMGKVSWVQQKDERGKAPRGEVTPD